MKICTVIEYYGQMDVSRGNKPDSAKKSLENQAKAGTASTAKSTQAKMPKRRKANSKGFYHLAFSLLGTIPWTSWILFNKLWSVPTPTYHMPIVPICASGLLLSSALYSTAHTAIEKFSINKPNAPTSSDSWVRTGRLFPVALASLMFSGVGKDSTQISPEEHKRAPIKIGITRNMAPPSEIKIPGRNMRIELNA